jgi:very-short-patch-repair endonuclease
MRTISSFRRDTAKCLSSNPTAAEAMLWRHLRRSPVLGTHFRRQVPIGPYIADFACMAARLVIEVDGSQHAEGRTAERDPARTRWLEAEGYRVLRFWNNNVSHNIAGVLEAIHDAMPGSLSLESTPLKHTRYRRALSEDADHPTPARSARRPSPSRGG